MAYEARSSLETKEIRQIYGTIPFHLTDNSDLVVIEKLAFQP